MRRVGVTAVIAASALMLAFTARPLWRELTGGWWRAFAGAPESMLAALAAAAAWAVGAWLTASAVLWVVASTGSSLGHTAHRLAVAVTPMAVRRVLTCALGVAVFAAPAAAAVAAETPAPAPTATAFTLPPLEPVPAPILAPPEFPATAAASPTPTPRRSAEPSSALPNLDRPTAPKSPRPAPAQASPAAPTSHPSTEPASSLPPVPSPSPATFPSRTSAGSAPTQVHEVVPGDTLWDLAVAALPVGATPAEITQTWQRWYAINRSRIGPDPGLLYPGELLMLPKAAQ